MAYRGFVLVDIEAVIHYQDGSHVRVATQFEEAAKFLNPNVTIGNITMNYGGVEYVEG